MEHTRALKVAGLVLALLLSGLTMAKRTDPDEVHFVVMPGAIPSVDDPTFGGSGSTAQRVLGVAVDGEAKAYPISILNFHEVVNDEVGGRPVAVTYCPLCATGVTFDRRVEGDVLTFSVSGRLYRNNLVMQDDRTGSLWSQAAGEAIQGAYEGQDLTIVPSTMTTLVTWKQQHPNTSVMAPPGGRNYDQDPYAGYESSDDVLYPGDGTPGPLAPKAMVYGLTVGGTARAYPVEQLARERVVQEEVAGRDVVVTYYDGAVQAFASEGRSFSHRSGFRMVDGDGAEWNMITGEGPDANLTRLDGMPSFWFSWTDFHPDTTLYAQDVGQAPSSGLQFNWLHPLNLVVVGVLIYAMYGLGRWCWTRWRERGGFASADWFTPEHGWVNGILAGIVATAVLYDASLSVLPVYRVGMAVLGATLLAWAGALVWEWRTFRDREMKSTILDPEGLWWDLEDRLDEELPPTRSTDDGPPWARLRLEPAGDRGEVWISVLGTVSVAQEDDRVKGLVDEALDRWKDEGNREDLK